MFKVEHWLKNKNNRPLDPDSFMVVNCTLSTLLSGKKWFVAGGYCAWLDGRTETWSDVDIFTDTRIESLDYADYYDEEGYLTTQLIISGIKFNFIYRSISTVYETLDDFIQDTLNSFDMMICAVGFNPETNKLVYSYLQDLNFFMDDGFTVLKEGRIQKYMSRAKGPWIQYMLELSKKNHKAIELDNTLKHLLELTKTKRKLEHDVPFSVKRKRIDGIQHNTETSA